MIGKTTRLVMIGVACGVLAALPAAASSVGSLMYLDGTTANAASDQNAEGFFYDSDGSGGPANGILDKDDILEGVININTLNAGSANVGGTTGNNEWSAVFAIKIESITPTGNPGEFSISFGPDPGFSARLLALDPAAPLAPAGTMVRFYEDTLPDFNYNVSVAASLDSAAAGAGGSDATASEYWDIGFTVLNPSQRPAGERWVGVGGLAFAALAGAPESTLLGTSNFGVNVLANYMGPPVVPQLDIAGNPIDIIGSSSIKGSGTAAHTPGAGGWTASSNSDFQFVALPVPPAMWAGFVLFGLLGGKKLLRRRLA
jgi:hypothetical protein